MMSYFTNFYNYSSLNKNLRSVCTKIVQQIVSKKGGDPWVLDMEVIRDKPTMIVGIDICNEGAGSQRHSTVGFVATLNDLGTRYFSTTLFVDNTQQMLNLTPSVLKAIEAFRAKNKINPERVIVYRDGVGQSQMGPVIDNEVGCFNKAFEKVGVKPELVFVIVQKKTTSRFKDGRSNPPPGTMINKDIVATSATHAKLKTNFDFYLISAHSNQGSVNPSHYWVHHESPPQTARKLSDQQICQLTFKLCHLYFNWPGTISVPAPCKYASKLAFLVQNVHRSGNQEAVHQDLANMLFYL